MGWLCPLTEGHCSYQPASLSPGSPLLPWPSDLRVVIPLLLHTPGHNTTPVASLQFTILLRIVPSSHFSQITQFVGAGTLIQPEYERSSSVDHLSTPSFGILTLLASVSGQLSLSQRLGWLPRPHIYSLR